MNILFLWCFNYMIRCKSGGMCTCKSIKQLRNLELSCRPEVVKKTYSLPLFDNTWANFSLYKYNTVVEKFFCLWATFKHHQQITVHSSKNSWKKFETTSANVTQNFSLRMGPKWNGFPSWKHGLLGSITCTWHTCLQLLSVAADLSCELW